MRILALAAALLAAGCIGPQGNDPPAPEGIQETAACPAGETPEPRDGARAVQVQLANGMAEPTCVRVYFDGVLVARAELPAQHPALHANPRPVADLGWDASAVTVRVVDAATGRAYEERVQLGGRTWVVAWVDEGATNVETYDEAPAWM
jgi:hypothetical protein